MSPNKVNETVTASHIRMASAGLRHSAAQTSGKYFMQPLRALDVSSGVDRGHWTAPYPRGSRWAPYEPHGSRAPPPDPRRAAPSADRRELADGADTAVG